MAFPVVVAKGPQRTKNVQRTDSPERQASNLLDTHQIPPKRMATSDHVTSVLDYEACTLS